MPKFLDDIRAGELWTKVKEVVSAAQQAAVSAITSQKNQPNGIAGLDASGKLQQMPTANDVGAVSVGTTINGKALTGNITLTVDDIGTSTIFLVSHPVGSLFE
ncbi:MAG: hypothetical protein KHX91_08480, partial [Clostridium sp.]|nr:hypothetical protein [Clostridium sp.]